MTILAEFQQTLAANAMLLLSVLAPIVVFVLAIHFLEKTIQRRLAERFGWNSVLWTGWLGTPIHELSHALMCVVFQHEIQEMSLFEPDHESGRLGFVRHAWRKGNWFAELGNFFIGTAPLAGGSVALFVLLWVFYPAALAPENLELAVANPGIHPDTVQNQWVHQITTVLHHVLNPANFITPRFWVFMYLVLCVGSHMAPSSSDYEGASKAAVMVLLAIVAGLLVVTVLVPAPQQLYATTFEIISPLFAVMAITVVLCAVATLIISILVSYFPRRYQVS